MDHRSGSSGGRGSVSSSLHLHHHGSLPGLFIFLALVVFSNAMIEDYKKLRRSDKNRVCSKVVCSTISSISLAGQTLHRTLRGERVWCIAHTNLVSTTFISVCYEYIHTNPLDCAQNIPSDSMEALAPLQSSIDYAIDKVGSDLGFTLKLEQK